MLRCHIDFVLDYSFSANVNVQLDHQLHPRSRRGVPPKRKTTSVAAILSPLHRKIFHATQTRWAMAYQFNEHIKPLTSQLQEKDSGKHPMNIQERFDQLLMQETQRKKIEDLREELIYREKEIVKLMKQRDQNE